VSITKANSSSKKTTTKRSGSKPREKKLTSKSIENILHTPQEKEILKLWKKRSVYKVDEKSTVLPTYIIREMPTPVDILSVDTLRRKIYQDVFLKYEIMRGNTVTYSPLWETFPFCIEAEVIKENLPAAARNIVNFRKKCRQLYTQHLKTQQQKLQKLGIFADWTTAEKTLEARHETKLFSFFDRLRDSKFLRDELKLSHWCPKCVLPLETGNTAKPISANTQYCYVKFPFNNGFEEFGAQVYFAIHLPISQLWEIAGTMALGVYENVPFYLTEYENQYLIFAEPQLKRFVSPNAKNKEYPEPLAKLKTAQLKDCTLAHPLFSLSDLHFFTIPENVIDTISDPSEKNELMDGIIPLNPAHHSLSYSIYNTLPEVNNSVDTKFASSSSTTPIFDESGHFTEEADTLCGLNLKNATQFITDELETRGCLINARKQKVQQLHCVHCNGLSVSRPYPHWVFSGTSTDIRDEATTLPEYWEHYNDEMREHIQNEVMNISDMPITSQRQWGVPLPVLRCDNCNDLITDKKILRAVRSSIRRGSEHWFRLSVEELLPTDTVCTNCHSKDFRKESTYIESYFANLLQTLDSSDFKKSTVETAINVVFLPRTACFKWLGELSVLSASLQLSRPSKESHPFKHLKLNEIEENVWETEIQVKLLQKYPADVLRLISITPDLHQVPLEEDGTQQLEALIEEYYQKYTHLKKILSQITELLSDLQKSTNSKKLITFSTETDDKVSENLTEHDALAISLTNQLLSDVEVAYKERNFFEMWQLLFDFCQTDLLFYFHLCQAADSDSALIALPSIFKVIVQRLAPLLSFLAEEIYKKGFSTSASIFEEKWGFLPPIISDNDPRTEWESLKKNHKSKT
jgi:isoleucyl-tRNA synthetase